MNGHTHTHATTPALASMFARESAVKAPARKASEPSALLRWLDQYFRATPEERMQDEYLAYWN